MHVNFYWPLGWIALAMEALLKTADIPVAETTARFGIARFTFYRGTLTQSQAESAPYSFRP